MLILAVHRFSWCYNPYIFCYIKYFLQIILFFFWSCNMDRFSMFLHFGCHLTCCVPCAFVCSESFLCAYRLQTRTK